MEGKYLMKNMTMSIPQFLAYERGELSLKDIKELNRSDSFLGELIKDKRVEKMIVFTLAGLNFASSTVLADTDEALIKVENIGQEMLTILQRVGLWVCIIGCIVEVLIAVFKKGGGQKEIISTIFKWLLILSSLYIVPALFKFIVGAFA